MRIRILLSIGAIAVLASACTTSSTGTQPTPPAFRQAVITSGTAGTPAPQVVRQTAFTCPDCTFLDVYRVIDGDTLGTTIGDVRLYGLNTPKRSEKCAIEAIIFLERVAGSQVRIEDGPQLFDSFGRHLGYLYDESGNSIDALLIQAGYARAWTEDGQHQEALMELEEKARENFAGCLWG